MMQLLYITACFLNFLILGILSIQFIQDFIKIETHSCLVIQDKCKQAISTCSVIYLCASLYNGISWQSAGGVTPIFGLEEQAKKKQ